jgi:hypothetical protein
MSSPEPSLSTRIRVMQIVAGALVAGSVSFLVLVLFLVWNNGGKGLGQPVEGALPIVSLLSLGMLLINTPAAFLLSGVILRKALDNLARQAPNNALLPASENVTGPVTDATFLLMHKQKAMIISMALWEGASFFGSIAYQLEASPFALVASIGGIILLLSAFPTEGRVSEWLSQQQRALAQLRARPGMGARR